MKTSIAFLTIVLILPVTSKTYAVYTDVYTSGGGRDWGNKPYSESSSTSSNGVNYLAIAEVQGYSLKGLSRIEHTDYSSAFGSAITTARTTIPLRVLSDGPISFDWLLSGELQVILENPASWYDNKDQDSAYYSISIIDTVSGDSAFSAFTLSVKEQDGIGSHLEQIDLLETYDFAEDIFSAGSLIDVTLELKTGVSAGYSFFGTGSVLSSNFSDSLTIGNLDNLVIVPEPASFILLLLGGMGLGRLRRRKSL